MTKISLFFPVRQMLSRFQQEGQPDLARQECSQRRETGQGICRQAGEHQKRNSRSPTSARVKWNLEMSLKSSRRL